MARIALRSVGLLFALALPMTEGVRAEEPRVPDKTESITVRAPSVPAESLAVATDEPRIALFATASPESGIITVWNPPSSSSGRSLAFSNWRIRSG